MIYVEMRGRLGNQLFKYAMARKMQIQRHNKDEICMSYDKVYSEKSKYSGWTNDLINFNITNSCFEYKDKKNFVFKNGNNFCKLYYVKNKILQKLFNDDIKFNKYLLSKQSIFNRHGFYQSPKGFIPFSESGEKNIFLFGSFQSSRYFDSIRSVLIKEFTPIIPRLEKNKKLYDIIENNESVCVSIRRGDYISVPKFKKICDICDLSYFIEAISIFNNILSNPKFIIFSDDIEWAKDQMSYMDNVFFEDGDDPVWEKLRLMYSCKNFVLSNSSFSWWAQYLSRNPSKKVISPQKWYRDGHFSDLIENDFIRLNTGVKES